MESVIFNRWLEIHKEIKRKKKFRNRIKIIKFENLILDYSKKIGEIFDWLKIKKSDHIYPKKYLIPEVSSKNVGIWKKIVSDKDANKIYKNFTNFYEFYNY